MTVSFPPPALRATPRVTTDLGTDFEGADVFALLVIGTRYVLVAATVAALVVVVIGTAVGLYAGYRRTWRDSVLMRITDFVLTIPGFPLLLVLSVVWKFGSAVQMGFVLGITGWGALARAVRSQTLSLRERGFIEAARGLGLSTRHIVLRELLPNLPRRDHRTRPHRDGDRGAGAPVHPVPALGDPGAARPGAAGPDRLSPTEPLDESRDDTGCLFAPRCPFATDKCRDEHPDLSTTSDADQEHACFYPHRRRVVAEPVS